MNHLPIQFTYEIAQTASYPEYYSRYKFFEWAHRLPIDLQAFTERTWNVGLNVAIAEPGPHAFHRSTEGDNWTYVRVDAVLHTVAHVSRWASGDLTVSILGHNEAAVEQTLTQLQTLYPKQVANIDDVLMKFWYLSTSGPKVNERRLQVPSWSEIAQNYPSANRAAINTLIGQRFAPERSGQLMVWHGPPGTGKTHAIRALAREWNEWCDTHFIIDPDNFLGASIDYLMTTMLYSSSRWKLLVLEDAGELISADAGLRAGHGLSRMLNVADGLLGQGMKTTILLTTNEPLNKLHPAVTRPGRCFANIEFGSFPAKEAAQWYLTKTGVDWRTVLDFKSHTLAELYERAGNVDQILATTERRSVGFLNS